MLALRTRSAEPTSCHQGRRPTGAHDGTERRRFPTCRRRNPRRGRAPILLSRQAQLNGQPGNRRRKRIRRTTTSRSGTPSARPTNAEGIPQSVLFSVEPSVCRPGVGADGTLHPVNQYPGRGQLPRATEESVSGGGAWHAGLRTHPHASHDAAPSLTYWPPTNQTHR